MPPRKVTEQHGLGRLTAVDERDRNFPARMLTLTAPPVLPRSRYYRTGPVLNQGATGTCVGHAWRGWLSSAQVMLPPSQGPDPFAIYDQATQVDEWIGNDQDQNRSFGTSVRAGAKIMASHGHLQSYLWAVDAWDVATWLLQGLGVVVFGTNWTADMFHPLPSSLVRPTGRVVGGHAYLCVGYSQESRLFRFQNSWGRAWGQRGRFSMTSDDVERLIRDQGEVCCATQLRLPPATIMLDGSIVPQVSEPGEGDGQP